MVVLICGPMNSCHVWCVKDVSAGCCADELVMTDMFRHPVHCLWLLLVQ